MSTPREVLSALAADFRKRNLSYAEVAALVGYKMQTVANMICSRREYLTLGQAARFSKAFGYNMDFLVSGKGSLNRDEGGDSRKLVALMGMLNRYLYMVDDPDLFALYGNMLALINEKDVGRADEYIRNQERIFEMISTKKEICTG